MDSPVIHRLLRLWFTWEGLEIFFFSFPACVCYLLGAAGPRGTRPIPLSVQVPSGGESCAVPEVGAPRGEQTAEQNVLNTPRLEIMKSNRI